ncbi:deoxyribodipyrimidine photo-lyase [Dyadobacter jejuensis]|uniref:Deoxyribodipyrimidine photo-lyase n=1 Tax=Dyadobacter jejuensis TaxID=1082580 RepID=A0A316AJM2_9BACT|nr:deoxyribodipyrimidine photo-lyase [Dyadobacter jejuensis]PWJ57732.1 deoxyribodipyrimidine photo-lyase [Dyadobacter jejuensis]
MTHRIIYWFRNDLRLQDNEAFFLAAQHAQQVIPVYVFDPRLFEPTTLGFNRTGILRGQYLLQAVASLRKELRERGSELLIRIGTPETIVAQMADHYQASYVFTSKKIGPKETKVESSLSKNLKSSNIDIKLPWIDTLLPATSLPFSIARLPHRFEQYLEAIQNVTPIQPVLPIPDSLALSSDLVIESGTIPSLAQMGLDPQQTTCALPSDIGEAHAQQVLKQFVADSLAGQYTQSIDPITDAQLSIWLSLGCLSPRQIYWAIEELPAPQKALIVRGLHKRDYAHYTLLKYGPRLFKPTGIKHEFEKMWQNDKESFQNWIAGATDRQDINAVMQKLAATGNLSGEERNLAAQYLVNELAINWTWGATYFESMLLDYDVAISWGRWNNIAEVGISAKG